jgi:hypothetical protein
MCSPFVYAIAMKFFQVALFFFFTLLISSCFTIPTYQGASNFKLEEFKPKENLLSFTLDLSVFNPNGYGIRVRKSTFDIFVGEKYLGKAKLQKAFKIKRKKETTCHVPILLELEKGVIFKLLSLVSSRKANLRLKGILKASIFGIPKRERIDQTQAINLKDLNINFGGLIGK